jgi:hypothetical protein
MNTSSQYILWLRWVMANGLGELFGLGLTAILAVMIFTRLDEQPGVVAVVIAFGLAVASGAIEATVLGLAQWWAMHPWLPTVNRRGWWLATLIGALGAYILGYLPSTLMSLGEQMAPQSSPPMTEPPLVVVLLFAAGLGAVGGAILSFAQWLVLRQGVQFILGANFSIEPLKR